MKQILLYVILSLYFLNLQLLNAQTQPTDTIRKTPFEKSIIMTNFEKRVKDKVETFLLRNNTPHLVTRVKLKIEYKTPQKEMIDYREVVIDGEILAGATKQFQLDSFDPNQRYYYVYSTVPGKHIGYPFFVTTTLLRYDIAVTE